jgi:hypothetical protein
MSATYTETFSNPRDSLPNVYNNVTAREVDFVTRFGDNWQALLDIIGISRPIRKAPGTQLISYTASVALESGNVDAGEVIPYSKATITQVAKADLTIEKYAKAVPIEDVSKYGAEIAVEKSDDAFLAKLQNVVLAKLYTFLNTGALTGVATTWQAALAKAQGEVLNKFAAMQKDVTEVVGFANILDAYDYLATASITIQTAFGITYVKDFLGYNTLFLLPADMIARNTVIATPVENIDLYYIDPGDSEFGRLGLNYTTQGQTNLIGFHAEGNYNTAVGASFALMGMALWAEYLDGIAVFKVEASGSLGSVTGFSTAAYAAGSTGDAELTVPDPTVAGGKYYFKAQASTAPSAPTYLAQFDTTGWTEVVDDQVVATTNGHKYRVVEVNGTGQAIASATGDVTAKT